MAGEALSSGPGSAATLDDCVAFLQSQRLGLIVLTASVGNLILLGLSLRPLVMVPGFVGYDAPRPLRANGLVKPLMRLTLSPDGTNPSKSN